MANPLEDMMRSIMGNGENPDRPARAHATLIADLKMIQQRYISPCPFGVGDLVTPMKDCNVKGHGEPHIVLEVRETPMVPDHAAGSGHGNFGNRLDMRVACEMNGVIAAFWVESFWFGAYRAN